MPARPTSSAPRVAARAVACTLIVGAACLVGPGTPRTTAAPEQSDTESVTIAVVSNRADLVSDGDALIEVTLPTEIATGPLTVTADGRDVSDAFTSRAGNRIRGVVDDLPDGDTVLEARTSSGPGARLTINNHPRGGPVFAGPQITPWICATADNGLGNPVDDQCNAPPRVSYVYQPTDAGAGEYEPYNPAKPPTDVATTTTDSGATVPYIIRVEIGTIDRSIYRTMVLVDPAAPWTALAPQAVWNRKLMFAFAGGCGTPHRQYPPNPKGPVFGNTASDGDIIQPALLSRGWMTATSGANSFNQNCNALVSAEAVMMLKERIADTLGEIRRTVSVGGSGGSVQQHYIATAYPGLLDGIVPTQSFPDILGMTWDTADCALATRYFLSLSAALWADVLDQLAVLGKDGPASCLQFASFFGDWFDPQNRGPFQVGASVRTGCALPEGRAYHPSDNPRGPRCAVQDYQKMVWGTGPDGAAPLPFDNVGVQYGLQSLEDGTISAAQFVDLNARIGGIDNEGEYTSSRSEMSPETAAIMYRANQTTDVRRLADIPILDLRDVFVDQFPETLSDMHQPYNTRTMRARLDAVNGTHANHVIWYPLSENRDIAAVEAIDRWLDAIDADTSSRPTAEKVIANKPADLVDTCWIDGRAETDPATCARTYPGVSNAGNARVAAGAPVTDDIRKCQLKPLDRADFSVAFDAAQWSTLRAAFPGGVCDWTRPSIGEQDGVPWLTYATGPGGEALGPAPVSAPIGTDNPPASSSAVKGLPATGIASTPGLLVGGSVIAIFLSMRWRGINRPRARC